MSGPVTVGDHWWPERHTDSTVRVDKPLDTLRGLTLAWAPSPPTAARASSPDYPPPHLMEYLMSPGNYSHPLFISVDVEAGSCLSEWVGPTPTKSTRDNTSYPPPRHTRAQNNNKFTTSAPNSKGLKGCQWPIEIIHFKHYIIYTIFVSPYFELQGCFVQRLAD